MFQGLTGASTSNGSSSHQSRRLDAWTPLSPLGESGQGWGGKIHYHLALPSVTCYREAVHRRGSKDWPETKRTFCQASATFALILGGFCPCGDFCWRDGGWWRPVLRTGSASFTSVMMYLRACVLSCCSCVQLFATLWTITCQTPLSMGFSRQEYWGGLPCTPPGDLPNPGIKPVFLMSLVNS